MINKDIYYESEESKYHSTSISEDKEVKVYSVDNKMEYPYLMLETETMPTYRIQVMMNTLTKKKFIQEGTPAGYYNVYLSMSGQIVGLGMLHSDHLKSLLQSGLYRNVNKYLMLDRDSKVEGDMMYSYCTSPLY